MDPFAPQSLFTSSGDQFTADARLDRLGSPGLHDDAYWEDYWTRKTVGDCLDDEFLQYLAPENDPLFAADSYTLDSGACAVLLPSPAASEGIIDAMMEDGVAAYFSGSPAPAVTTAAVPAEVLAAFTDVAIPSSELPDSCMDTRANMAALEEILVEQQAAAAAASVATATAEEEGETAEASGATSVFAASPAACACQSPARSVTVERTGLLKLKITVKIRSAGKAAGPEEATAALAATAAKRTATIGKAGTKASQGKRGSGKGAAKVPGPTPAIAKAKAKKKRSSTRVPTGEPIGRRKGGVNAPPEILFLYHLDLVADKTAAAKQFRLSTAGMIAQVQQFLRNRVMGKVVDDTMLYQTGYAKSRPMTVTLDKARLKREGIATWAAFQARYMPSAAAL